MMLIAIPLMIEETGEYDRMMAKTRKEKEDKEK
jgi:hypothetical protein